MSCSRREFLKAAVGTPALLTLAPSLPPFLARTAAAAPATGENAQRVLVVLQLSGGNDGLNTVVPAADDAYGRNRRTLRWTPPELHKIDDLLGFHPALDGLARLFHQGALSIVQGVGYPGSDRSHDVALRDWHTARPGDSGCHTGWLGRAIDRLDHPATADLPGVFVGTIDAPLGITAERFVVPTLHSPAQLCLRATTADEAAAASTAHSDQASDDNPLADYVRRGTTAALAGSRQLRDVLAASSDCGEYPDFPLAGHLKMIAQLIRAELGIRIFFVELGGGGIGGFDNHANQRDNHAALLRQLSSAVTAFVDDLQHGGWLEHVRLMTFSEFGRTLSENGRRGTDHGAAQPVFLAGGALRGGLIGSHPSLTDLEQDAPQPHTDFRRLYATMLENWLGIDSQSVLGTRFELLDV